MFLEIFIVFRGIDRLRDSCYVRVVLNIIGCGFVLFFFVGFVYWVVQGTFFFYILDILYLCVKICSIFQLSFFFDCFKRKYWGINSNIIRQVGRIFRCQFRFFRIIQVCGVQVLLWIFLKFLVICFILGNSVYDDIIRFLCLILFKYFFFCFRLGGLFVLYFRWVCFWFLECCRFLKVKCKGQKCY